MELTNYHQALAWLDEMVEQVKDDRKSVRISLCHSLMTLFNLTKTEAWDVIIDFKHIRRLN